MSRTIKDILALFPETTNKDWKQHARGDGWVCSTAHAHESSFIEGIVYGNALVYNDARVYGDAQVYGNAWVYDNAQVYGNALVYGNARVYGNAQVCGNARVYGNARVFGDAWVYGDAWVFGDARVSGDAWKTTPLLVQGTKHTATNCKHGFIAIGCQVHTFAHWQTHVESIARAHGYTEVEVAEYRSIVDFIVKVGK